MTPFLAQVVDDLARRGVNWQATTFITPNQRSGLFLKKHILAHPGIAKPLWMPRFLSIQEFAAQQSDLELLDPLSLVFRLYPIYRAVFNYPKAFDAFYAWGQIVLGDFNEMDLYLVERPTLFRHLRDLSQIDAEFGGTGPLMADFVRFSASLEKLYQSLQESLLLQNQAYYGLALRRLVEGFDPQAFAPWGRLVFAGFNALSTAEERLIQRLVDEDLAWTYWDVDAQMLDDQRQEAGYFLRESPLIEDRNSTRWIEQGLAAPKTIEIIGAAGRVAQAKALGLMLAEGNASLDDTAVVLADPTLLFPVLHSLPEALDRVNVTMGYPLRHTPLYHLVQAVVTLHAQREDEAEGDFRFLHVQPILLHPLVLPLAETAIRQLVAEARKANRVRVHFTELLALHPALEAAFRAPATTADFIGHLMTFLMHLVEAQTGQVHRSLEVEVLYQFHTRLQRILDMVQSHDIDLELATFWSLFKEILDSSTLPFLGEPLEGLQLMGLLETRTLDFRQVFLLGANEGALPAAQSHTSFIPNEVRRQCGMITHAHQDAVFAYTFYRLLMRAETVRIFYSTSSDALGRGERSRFIDQLIHEFAKSNPNTAIRHRTVNMDTVFDRPGAISVAKTDEILRCLETMDYSATRLQAYVGCRLRFYFRYVLGLSEQDEVVETADAKIFGTVIHETLNRLFDPVIGQTLTAEALGAMERRCPGLVEEVYREKVGQVNVSAGRNYLSVHVIQTLLGHYLKGETTGKRVLGTEKKLSCTLNVGGRPLQLTGTIDRMDQHPDGGVDIIDFKTGRVDSLIIDLDAEVDRVALLETFRKNPQILQLLVYALLAADGLDPEALMRLGIYSFKAQKEEGRVRFLSAGRGQVHGLSPVQDRDRIERLLTSVFEDLLDPEQPFDQVEDASYCGYCPFTEICGR